jgi:hypothetical protein
MLILLLVLIKKFSLETQRSIINSSADGQLDLVADTEIQIAATTVDLNGNLDVSGTTVSAGKITADAGIDIDNINIDGTTIALSSGDLTLDVAGNIRLDADDNGEIRYLDGGTQYAAIKKDGNAALFQSIVADGDFIIQGIDGASFVSALTLDMSAAGAATFNAGITATTGTFSSDLISKGTNTQQVIGFNLYDTQQYNLFVDGNVDASKMAIRRGTTEVVGFSAAGAATFSGVVTANAGVVVDNFTLDGTTLALSSGDLTLDIAGTITLDADNSGTIYLKDGGTTYGQLFQDSNRFFIQSTVPDADMLFRGSDAGDVFTALTLDMSDAGAATFSNGITLTDGNLVVASGHGIDFSATAGSGTSELLDDYEEGAWTPVTSNGSWTVNSAGYTKVGNMVTCQFKVTATATISSNDFTGLPFVPAVESGGVCGYQNSEAGEVFSIAVQSSNVWNFRVGSDQKGLASGALVYGAFTYQTTA